MRAEHLPLGDRTAEPSLVAECRSILPVRCATKVRGRCCRERGMETSSSEGVRGRKSKFLVGLSSCAGAWRAQALHTVRLENCAGRVEISGDLSRAQEGQERRTGRGTALSRALIIWLKPIPYGHTRERTSRVNRALAITSNRLATGMHQIQS